MRHSVRTYDTLHLLTLVLLANPSVQNSYFPASPMTTLCFFIILPVPGIIYRYLSYWYVVVIGIDFPLHIVFLGWKDFRACHNNTVLLFNTQ